MQYSLVFDTDVLELFDINNEHTSVSSTNFGYSFLDEGALLFSWNGTVMGKNTDLYTIRFKTKKDGTLSEILQINSRHLSAEAYSTPSSGKVNTSAVRLEFYNEQGHTVQQSFTLFPNRPNPFRDATTVSFYLPQADYVTLQVLDATGKLIHAYSAEHTAGYNTIELNTAVLNGAGVYYYRVQTTQNMRMGKMMVVE